MVTCLVVSALLFAAAAETPADLDAAYQNLKDAEQKKDAALVKKWAEESSRLARQAIKNADGQASPQVEYAKQIETYADYALYVTALRATDRQDTISLFEALQQQSPSSSYTKQLYGTYAAALLQSGQAEKAFQFAETAIANDASNPDLLAILADGALHRKQFDQAAKYGVQLAGAVESRPAPEGVAAADWEQRRVLLGSRGNWIAGMAYASLKRYAEADKHLRAALPNIKGDNQLMAGALFYLGLADYNLAMASNNKALMTQALNYSQSAAKYPGPYQKLAAQNVTAIKQHLNRLR